MAFGVSAGTEGGSCMSILCSRKFFGLALFFSGEEIRACLEAVASGGDSAFDHPVGVVSFFEAHFEFSVGVFEDDAFEDGFDVGALGVGGVDGVDHVPECVPVCCVVLAGEDDVVGEFDSEVDWFVLGVGVPVCFFGLDGSEEFVVSFLVGGS